MENARRYLIAVLARGTNSWPVTALRWRVGPKSVIKLARVPWPNFFYPGSATVHIGPKCNL